MAELAGSFLAVVSGRGFCVSWFRWFVATIDGTLVGILPDSASSSSRRGEQSLSHHYRTCFFAPKRRSPIAQRQMPLHPRLSIVEKGYYQPHALSGKEGPHVDPIKSGSVVQLRSNLHCVSLCRGKQRGELDKGMPKLPPGRPGNTWAASSSCNCTIAYTCLTPFWKKKHLGPHIHQCFPCR